ncbi:hypothetical protein AB0G04_24700 [Actinoplanes sp. NPDC023801]|uniref:hypothetical protein n=1 Tax=Actinoplanes sp. NPDC023801 TaxID=3154595 RepID=UPI0034080107
MSLSGLQGWHIPLFVTAVILLAQLVADRILANVHADRKPKPRPEPSRPEVERELAGKRLRAGVLVALGVIAVPLFAVSFLGPTLADQLAGATGTGLGGLTLWLAWQSHRESKRLSAYLEQITPGPPPGGPPTP